MSEKFRLFQAVSEKNRFFGANFRQISIFSAISKNLLFTIGPRQIILFLFKSHHFGTYFLYMIRYNNILRPVHDPHDPPETPAIPQDPHAQNLGVATPRVDVYVSWFADYSLKNWLRKLRTIALPVYFHGFYYCMYLSITNVAKISALCL